MTSDIFESWLDKINSNMAAQCRSIVLFIDNCTAHPDVVRSNVKLMFPPPNTTSKLQPLDAGIIQNIKIYYRKQILCHVLGHMDGASCVTELAKKVHIIDTIMWLKSAWDAVGPETMEVFHKVWNCGHHG